MVLEYLSAFEVADFTSPSNTRYFSRALTATPLIFETQGEESTASSLKVDKFAQIPMSKEDES